MQYSDSIYYQDSSEGEVNVTYLFVISYSTYTLLIVHFRTLSDRRSPLIF